MKRFTFLLVIITLGCLINPVIGQEFYFGVTGGMNLADMKIIGDGEEQTVNPRNLYGIGGILGLQFNKSLSVQLRPLYLKKGGTLDQEQPSLEVDFTMSYLEFDISLKVATGNQFRPYVLAGPSIGFLMTSEAEFEDYGYTLKADLMDISKKIEYGFGIGAGIDYSLRKGFLFLEGRYTFGMNNLNKGGTVEFILDGTVVDTEELDKEDEYKNRGFQIMAGYAFSLGKN